MVVETIDFYEDEEAELPPPMTLRDVQVCLQTVPESWLCARKASCNQLTAGS